MRYKYPRTFHLPWSLSLSSDDISVLNCSHFFNKEVVVTEKLDGENTTMYCDYIHARSLDSRNHASRNWVKNLHASIKHNIPENYRICGENVYACHSIGYSNLPSYFFVFAVYSDDTCLSWNETKEYASLLGLKTVPELYHGIYNEEKIKSSWNGKSCFSEIGEGYVIRLASSFLHNKHNESIAKYVRSNHVQKEDKHWMNSSIIRNELKNGSDSV